jgi:hypothetical protein
MTDPKQNEMPPRAWLLRQRANGKWNTFWSFDGPPSEAYVPLLSVKEHTRALEEKNKRIAEIEEELKESRSAQHANVVVYSEEISRLQALLAGSEADNKAVGRQVADLMEFMIWLKGYEYIDGPIEDRITEVLESVVRLGADTAGEKNG